MPRKTVAIRGLDLNLYHEVFSIAKKDGKRVSDVMNKAIEEFLDAVESGFNGGDGDTKKENGRFVLRNDGEILLSKQDILGIKREVGPFNIENTGNITFDKDVDKDALKNIEQIVIHSGNIHVPRNVYPQVLMRSEIHGKLSKY